MLIELAHQGEPFSKQPIFYLAYTNEQHQNLSDYHTDPMQPLENIETWRQKQAYPMIQYISQKTGMLHWLP